MCWRGDVILCAGVSFCVRGVILNDSEESHAKGMLRCTQHDKGGLKRCFALLSMTLRVAGRDASLCSA